MTVKILIGDVREQLRLLPADHFDCVVTSPPYWGLRDYGVAGQIGLERTLGEHLEVIVDVFSEVWRVMKPTATLWLNYGDCYATSPNGRSAADTKAAGNDDRTFRDKPFSTVGPIYRGGAPSSKSTLRGNGHIGGGPKLKSLPPVACERSGPMLKAKDLCMIPNRLAIALQEAGWWVRSEIIWHKPNPMPESIKDRPGTSHEKVWLLSKCERYFYDAEAVAEPRSSEGGSWVNGWATEGDHIAAAWARDKGNAKSFRGGGKYTGGQSFGPDPVRRETNGNAATDSTTRNLRNVWTIATAAFSDAHFATFPPALVERCIKAGCPADGHVLDPFGGAGTTGLVADRLQRHATLIELNPEYAALARRRIDGDAPLFAGAAE